MKIKCLLLFIITSNILAYSIIIPTNASNNIPLSIEGTTNIKGNIINVCENRLDVISIDNNKILYIKKLLLSHLII